MKISLNAVPMLVAALAAVALSLPHPTSASLAVGGAECSHNGRKESTCPSAGAGSCTKTRQICNSDGDKVSICSEGGGSLACSARGDCGEANHASDDSACTPPGSGS